jgi:carbon dioxide concentrating mechanism protein CcmL
MRIAYVVGSTVSTIKDERLLGAKLLIVREATVTGEIVGEPFIAVDGVGAGSGELVFVAEGSAARQTQTTKDAPVDATIVGIIDSLEVENVITFRKG